MIAPGAVTTATPAAAGSGAAGAANGAAALTGGDAAAMPADVLLALFAAEAAPFAQALAAVNAEAHAGGAQPGGGDGRPSRAPGSAPDGNAPAVPDPAAAALAAVLQWLQQQSAAAQPQAVPDASAQAETGEPQQDPGALTVGRMAASPVADPAPGAQVMAAGTGAATAAASAAATDSRPARVAAAVPLPDPPADALSPDTQRILAADSKNSAASAGGGGAQPGLDLAVALRAAAASAPSPVERSIAVPVQDRHWAQAVAAQVLILSDAKVQAATLRLSPEHLGPVEVRIDLQGTRVDVAFGAAHVDTRAALEQALPQLRAVLAGAGLTLGQATVQQQARQASQNLSAAARLAGGAADQPEAAVAVIRAIGMVDEYV